MAADRVAEIPPEVFRTLHDRADIFAERVFGDFLWSKQREILRSVSEHERTAVKSCHGPGKTHTAAQAAIWFLCTRKPSEVVTTAPTWRQVEKLLWKEINLAWARAVPEVRALAECLTTRLVVGPGHEAYGLSTNDTDKFQGIHSPHLMVIVDEASGLPDEIYEAVDTLSAGGEYRELLIGNPIRPEGKFYRAFQNPELGYNRISIAVDETPNWTGEDVPDEVRRVLVQPERVEKWAVDWGRDSPAYVARVRAEFPEEDATRVLVPLAWAEAAQRREEGDAEGDVQVGVDVARYGEDRTAIGRRKGRVLRSLRSYPGDTSGPQVAGYARAEAEAALAEDGGPVVVVIDETGVGGPVLDMLQADAANADIRYEGLHFGAAALDAEHFLNRRAEIYWHMRLLLQEGGMEPDMVIAAEGDAVQRFISQVSAMRYDYSGAVKLRIEKKDDMKKRGMPSPDEADAVVLAFAPVKTSRLEIDYF